jgi:hypothetical protein
MKKILIATVTMVALLAEVIGFVPVAQASLNIPKSSWAACSATRTSYCVQSVVVTPAGGSPVTLTYVPSGQALVNPDTTTVSTETPTAPSTPIVATGSALAGRWTSLEWKANGLDVLGYDGLFVDAHALEFVNHVFINVLPTYTNSSSVVNTATQLDNVKYAANLDPDVQISVTIKTGEIKPGVLVGIGTNFTGDYATASGQSTIKFTANPVMVPLAAKVADCIGETGVAVAMVRQVQAMLFINNEGQSAFGVDGMSGDMVISSNGLCDLSTPVWNATDKAFTWSAAAPHFAKDGVTENVGFYRAIIPVADAKLLWGLENANDAAKALDVQVITAGEVTRVASSTIGVLNGKIVIEVAGFGYSKPKLRVSLNKNWTPSKNMQNKKTITCILGKSIKKITAVKPSCPKGYVKKK